MYMDIDIFPQVKFVDLFMTILSKSSMKVRDNVSSLVELIDETMVNCRI